MKENTKRKDIATSFFSHARNALKTVRLWDWLMVFLSLGIASVSAVYVYGNTEGTPRLLIESPKGQWIYELKTDITVPIPGTEGDTVVQIANGRAFVTDSPCTNKTCLTAHPIEQPLQWIACLPNQVFIRIEGSAKKDDGTDIMAF
ncbi:MAG: NusG domain II-containing protein [Spirochaetaceae bacterium]|jgi:hypothetical protein|nr:NusG domain II-containing protein [Spirochaetaceae bacterium]